MFKIISCFLLLSSLTFCKFEKLYEVSIKEYIPAIKGQKYEKVSVKDYQLGKGDQNTSLLRLISYPNKKNSERDYERLISELEVKEVYLQNKDMFIAICTDGWIKEYKKFGTIIMHRKYSNQKGWNKVKNYMLANDMTTELEIAQTELATLGSL